MPRPSVAAAWALVALALPLTALAARAQTPQLRLADITVPEGNAGTTNAELKVTLSAAAKGEVTVDYTTENVTATGGASCGGDTDYVTESGSVRFAPGETNQPIEVAVCGDTEIEDTERFRVRLSNASGATIQDQAARVTITNDDEATPPLPSLSIDDASFPEGNAGTVTREATVRLSAATNQPVTVTLAVLAGGTASGGSCSFGDDFVAFLPRTLTINPGQTVLTSPLGICGLSEVEPDEILSLGLRNPVNATLGDSVGQVTIANDDDPPPPPGGADLIVDVSKAGAVPEIPTNSNVAFVFTVSNVGSRSVDGVLTRVSVPATFTSLSTTPEPGSGITCTIAGAIVVCTAPTLAPGAPKTFRITATAPATITGTSQKFKVAAQVDPGETIPESENENNSDDLLVTVITRADLDVDLPSSSAFLTQLAPNLVVVVTARNTGDRAAPNVLVRTTLPENVAFVRVEENQLGTCSTDGALRVNCTLSSLPAGANRHVRIIGTITGTIADSTQFTFAATVDPNNTVLERSETDNTAFMITTVRAPADLQVTGVLSVTNVRKVGPPIGACARCRQTLADLQLRLVVRNTGPFRSAPTTVLTVWPNALKVSEPSGLGTCNSNERCSIAIPAVNSGATFTFDATAKWQHFTHDPETAQLTATVDPEGNGLDPIVGNNTSTISVTVQ